MKKTYLSSKQKFSFGCTPPENQITVHEEIPCNYPLILNILEDNGKEGVILPDLEKTKENYIEGEVQKKEIIRGKYKQAHKEQQEEVRRKKEEEGKKKKRGPNMSQDARFILDYWNNNSGAAHIYFPTEKKNGEVTKTYQETVRTIESLLEGTFQGGDIKELRRVFSREEFIKAIDNFSLSVENAAYFPVDKTSFQKTTFTFFVFNRYTGKSLFIYCLNNSPRKVIETIDEIPEDLFPEIKEKLVEKYFEIFCSGKRKLEKKEEVDFIHGSYFLAQLDGEIKHRSIGYLGGWISLLFESLVKYREKGIEQKWSKVPEITSCWFARKRTYEDTLFKYLVETSVLSSPERDRKKFSDLLEFKNTIKEEWKGYANSLKGRFTQI